MTPFFQELEKIGFDFRSLIPSFLKSKSPRTSIPSIESQKSFAASTGKVNAPTFAYQAVYKKDPEQFLSGRTNAPKKMWNGFDVDKGIKDEWLDRLNKLPVEIRSTDEGKSWDRPAFVVIRMPEEYDNLYEKMGENLEKNQDLHIKADIGMTGRPRICIAGKIKKGDKGWEQWWESLPVKIEDAYMNTIHTVPNH